MNKKTVKDIKVKGKKILLRVDFNVPLEPVEPPVVADDSRIRESLPTINYLLGQDAQEIVIIAHLGRPNGKAVDGLRMMPIAKKLAELLGVSEFPKEEHIGGFPAYRINSQIIILENIRFWEDEEENNSAFAKKLSHLGEIFVNDAFGTAHRAHASTAGVAKFMPAVAGLLMEAEIESLKSLLIDPARPYIAIQGGIKISDKIDLMVRLMDLVDFVLVGSGLAATLYKAQGYSIGNTKFDEKALKEARKVMAKAESKGNLVLPVDFIVAGSPVPGSKKQTIEVLPEPSEICESPSAIFDIGPKTVKMFEEKIKNAKTIFWNGPLGFVEVPDYEVGSKKIAQLIGQTDAKSILGGGDVVAFVDRLNLRSNFSMVSTGGGAALDFISGQKLPGIEVLLDK